MHGSSRTPEEARSVGGGQPSSGSGSLRVLPEELFATGHLEEDLAGRTARGGLAALSSQGAQLILHGLGVVVLARILTPADYGLVGMVAVVIGMATVFRDGGLATGTIQRDEVTHEQLSAVFWVNVALLVIVGLIMAASAPLVAWFYRQPQLTAMTVVLAASFVINGLSVQHDALLRRHMRFGAVAVTQIVAVGASLCVSVAMGLAGLGPWALIGGTVAAGVTSTVASFAMCPWVPGRPVRGHGARGLLRFGRDLTIFNVFNYGARNADNILIGRFTGATALGLYSRAYALFLTPMTQIRAPLADVSMPALSSLKEQPERYAHYYRRFLGALAFATVPITAYCVLKGDFVIAVLLGPQWQGAALVFRILAAAGIVQTIASTRGLVLLSLGRSRRYMWLGVVNAAAMVTAFVIGLRWGIVGVAAAYAVANYLVLVPTLAFSFAGTPVTMRLFFGVLLRPVGCAAVASVALLVTERIVPASGTIVQILAGAAFALVYVALVSRSSLFRETWRAFAGRLMPTARRPRPGQEPA